MGDVRGREVMGISKAVWSIFGAVGRYMVGISRKVASCINSGRARQPYGLKYGEIRTEYANLEGEKILLLGA